MKIIQIKRSSKVLVDVEPLGQIFSADSQNEDTEGSFHFSLTSGTTTFVVRMTWAEIRKALLQMPGPIASRRLQQWNPQLALDIQSMYSACDVIGVALGCDLDELWSGKKNVLSVDDNGGKK